MLFILYMTFRPLYTPLVCLFFIAMYLHHLFIFQVQLFDIIQYLHADNIKNMFVFDKIKYMFSGLLSPWNKGTYGFKTKRKVFLLLKCGFFACQPLFSIGVVPSSSLLCTFLNVNTLYSCCRYGLQPVRGVLLHGPPGTGKSSLARAAACEAGVKLYTINGPEIVSDLYGESEAALRAVFSSAAKSSPSVVRWFDFSLFTV